MSEILESLVEARLFGSSSDSYGQCCPPVFDPYTLVALLGGIALATFFLRLVIITVMPGRSLNSGFLGIGTFTDDPNWLTNIVSEIFEINEEVNKEESEEQIEERSFNSDYGPSLLTSVTRNTTVSGMAGVCRSEVWSCMSGVMEGGIKYIERPEDIYTALQPVLYKAVFHGGMKSMWSSVMEVSAMRKMGQCITDHDACVEHDVLSNYL